MGRQAGRQAMFVCLYVGMLVCMCMSVGRCVCKMGRYLCSSKLVSWWGVWFGKVLLVNRRCVTDGWREVEKPLDSTAPGPITQFYAPFYRKRRLGIPSARSTNPICPEWPSGIYVASNFVGVFFFFCVFFLLVF